MKYGSKRDMVKFYSKDHVMESQLNIDKNTFLVTGVGRTRQIYQSIKFNRGYHNKKGRLNWSVKIFSLKPWDW